MTTPQRRLSGFYGFYFAALGGFLPFWSLYLKSKGFNAQEIGELNAILVSTKLISPNISGWIADTTGKNLLVVRLSMLFATLFFLSFLNINTYWAFFYATLAFSFFWNAALPQFEVATLLHIQTEPLRYSQIRLWGSVGFIATVLSTGQILNTHSISILPYLISGLLASAWILALTIPEAKTKKNDTRRENIWSIVFTRRVLAFLSTYLLLQAAHSPYYVFFSIYLKQYHYSTALTGILWALGVLAEIGLFLIMPRILRQVTLRKLLLISILLSIVRWFIIARYAQFLWLLTIAQLLHAASFAALHVVAMHLIQHYFGKHHQGKGQALYTSFSYGIGGILGNYYSGYFWELLGAEHLFLLAAYCCAVAFVIATLGISNPVNSRF